MEILKATLRNFGPYYGKHEITLAAGERPVTLVHGENMRGKTSLLRAIQWALYGSARARGGEAMPINKLLNTDALSEGSFDFSVELEIRDGNDNYVLTRQAQASHRPSKGPDFQITSHLRRNDNFLSTDETKTVINRLLPEAVSHFFLFDGEMLNDFEDLLSDSQQQAQAIRRSIEQILGVPSLENAIEDVQHLLGDVQRKRDKAAQNVKAAQRDADRAAELAAAIGAIEADVRVLEGKLAEAKTSIAEVDERLRAYEQIKADFNQLGEWRDRKSGTDVRLDELRVERRRALSHAWKDVVADAVAPQLAVLEARRDELARLTRQVARTQSQRETLEGALLDSSQCPTCGQDIGTKETERIKSMLAALPVEELPDPDELESVVASIGRLRRVVGTGAVLAKVASVEGDVRRLTVERTRAANRVTEIETKLRDHDLADVAQAQKERDRLTKHEGAVEQEIREAGDRLAALNTEAVQVRHRISQVSDPQLDRLNREVEVYAGLHLIFQEALTDLRDELKVIVERDASEIFKRLTTDPNYSGLRINDSYGLYILDAIGSEVFPSAGAEQVVALSLIGALNRNAVKRGPVIMDTPFGRLDKKHRANILTFLPSMADQVVLLVHGGEVDRQRDLETIAPFVEREYELEYVSPTRTNIVPMGRKVS